MRKQTLEVIKETWLNDSRLSTHYEGCWRAHYCCAIRKLVNEVEALKIKLNRRDKTIKAYQKLKEG
jgi:hypothetical protein